MNGGGEDGRLTGMKRGSDEKAVRVSRPRFSLQTASRFLQNNMAAPYARSRSHPT